jgi:hypothetical protein
LAVERYVHRCAETVVAGVGAVSEIISTWVRALVGIVRSLVCGLMPSSVLSVNVVAVRSLIRVGVVAVVKVLIVAGGIGVVVHRISVAVVCRIIVVVLLVVRFVRIFVIVRFVRIFVIAVGEFVAAVE